ncbi:MAG: DhnA family fructose-bisphosphate aldolase class Ia [Pseudoalteromonas tetraodonis]
MEALPYGIGRGEDYTLANIGFTVRMAAELGADVVKTAFPTGASVDEFREIIESCFVPVIVLGGAAMGDDEALLKMVRDAMAAGAAGVAVGRNVWQHKNPVEIGQRMAEIIHG